MLNHSQMLSNSCRLSDIEACSVNEACVQTNVEENEFGVCFCLEGYFRNGSNVSDNVCNKTISKCKS